MGEAKFTQSDKARLGARSPCCRQIQAQEKCLQRWGRRAPSPGLDVMPPPGGCRSLGWGRGHLHKNGMSEPLRERGYPQIHGMSCPHLREGTPHISSGIRDVRAPGEGDRVWGGEARPTESSPVWGAGLAFETGDSLHARFCQVSQCVKDHESQIFFTIDQRSYNGKRGKWHEMAIGLDVARSA